MSNFISIRGARVHNLKNVNVDIPKNKLVVITGLSGSGKSSLAFDTIYAEGQRRYMESLSSYARQFLELQDKPDVDEITGLSPTIAIDQKSSSHNPRSTVGTVTEIYDFLRVLFARAGRPHCPKCRQKVGEQTLTEIVTRVTSMIGKSGLKAGSGSAGDRTLLFAPVVHQLKGEHKHVLQGALNAGFTQVRFDGLLIDTTEALAMRKDKKKDHDIDVLVFSFEPGMNYAPEHVSAQVNKALEYGNGFILLVNDETGDEFPLSKSFMCPNCGINLPKPEPRLFSFNSPAGACEECTGLGEKLVLEAELVIPNRRLTFEEGAVRPWTKIAGNQTSYLDLLQIVGKKHHIPMDMPIQKISKAKMELVLNGTGDDAYTFKGETVTFPGILMQLEQKYRETDSEYVRAELEGYMRRMICPSCDGRRLNKAVLAITIDGKSISDVVNLPVEDVKAFFEEVVKPARTTVQRSGGVEKVAKVAKGIQGLTSDERLVTERVAKEVRIRLDQLTQVGLGYLTLDRSAMTLSGGESQRVRLATQLGSQLSGVIYILDEPSIGLHPRDNDCLIETIRQLKAFGNSVIVVEHDEAMIRAADYVFDVGPGAGEYGGQIVSEGTAAQIEKDKDSLTGQYLSGAKSIPLPKKYRKGSGKKMSIVGANAFNLKNVDVEIPLGCLVCVTGVSGSGKSTLVLDILGKALSRKFYRAKLYPGEHKEIKGIEHIDKVVAVDQSPIGRTPRSNPATYTGVFTAIRDLFADLPEAKMRKYDAGKFSFNVK
ncbi:MAG: excinuclease ABC subunit UvrA, partial [Patescibacteria group bacterium]